MSLSYFLQLLFSYVGYHHLHHQKNGFDFKCTTQRQSFMNRLFVFFLLVLVLFFADTSIILHSTLGLCIILRQYRLQIIDILYYTYIF